MNRLSVDLLKIALQIEDSFPNENEISYQEIMIQELLGTPTAAYLSETTCDPGAVRELVLAGVQIGLLLATSSHNSPDT